MPVPYPPRGSLRPDARFAFAFDDFREVALELLPQDAAGPREAEPGGGFVAVGDQPVGAGDRVVVGWEEGDDFDRRLPLRRAALVELVEHGVLGFAGVEL